MPEQKEVPKSRDIKKAATNLTVGFIFLIILDALIIFFYWAGFAHWVVALVLGSILTGALIKTLDAIIKISK